MYNKANMQTPYNGIFLKSETAALLCDRSKQLALDVFKPCFLRCDKDPVIMQACMEAVSTQFSEEMFEKYTRQICNRHRDFEQLVTTVITQMAHERHNKNGYAIQLEGAPIVICKLYVKRFLISMSTSDSVKSGRYFDPTCAVENAIVTQSNTRDVLWGVADEFIRVEKEEDDISVISSHYEKKKKKNKKKKKHDKDYDKKTDSVVSSVISASIMSNHDLEQGGGEEDEHWGEVDDTVDPLDSVSQVFANTDRHSTMSNSSNIKMSPPIRNKMFDAPTNIGNDSTNKPSMARSAIF